MTRIQAPFHPIIYIRGYAGTDREIEDTVATPYMGFNLGATKIRQDYTGKPHRFIFESPLIRLMKDHEYVDTYRDGDLAFGLVPARSVWIFRYYEPVSAELGLGETRSIVTFATELRRFVLQVRDRVCENAADRTAFRCYLVAHSMGGLIVRCYLQNISQHGTGDAQLDAELELPGSALVDKVFTYATPHNGIELLGINTPNLGWFNRDGSSNFNRGVMRKYLAIQSPGEDANTLDGRFPAEKFFCLVGSNHRDYGAVMGLSRRATGAMSDGLVMIRNATVDGAPRAFVHRSHSGDYGIVNSEEGYQNLRRFLFGNRRVDARLRVLEVTLPREVQSAKDEGKQIRASYHIETVAGVRGAGYRLHERLVAQESAILARYDEVVKQEKPVYLFSGFLLESAKTTSDTALAFAIRVAIQVPVYEVDNRFWFDNHFEGGYLFDETITFHLRRGDEGPRVRYGLTSRHGPGRATVNVDVVPLSATTARVTVPLGFAAGAANPPRPGLRGELWLDVSAWNESAAADA